MTDGIQVGMVHITKTIKRRTSEEVAAWYTEIEFAPQSVPMMIYPKMWSTGAWGYKLNGIVVDDYYPALFHGYPVSNNPYEPKYIGQKREMNFNTYLYTLGYMLVETGGLLGVSQHHDYTNSFGAVEIWPDMIEVEARPWADKNHMHMLKPNPLCQYCDHIVRSTTHKERVDLNGYEQSLDKPIWNWDYVHCDERGNRDSEQDHICYETKLADESIKGWKSISPWPRKDQWMKFENPGMAFNVKLKAKEQVA